MLLRLSLLILMLIQLVSCSIFSMNELIMGKRENSNLLKFPFLVENNKAIFKRDLTGTEAILYNNDAYRYSVFVQIGGDTNSMFMNTANYIGWSTENNHNLNIEPDFCSSGETYTVYDINTGNSPSGPVMKGPVVFDGTSSNATINNVPLADLSDSNVSEQLVLGLGLNPNTLSNDVIDEMYSQGLIESKLFSLFLHNIDLNGDIIFGGVDNSLYSGVIKYVDVDTSSVQSSSHGGWYIKLDGVQGTDGDYISSTSYVASIDTSTYYSYLPHAIASEMATQLGATEQDGYYSGPCESLYANTKNFTLTFDNDIEITVSSAQLFYKEDQDGQCDLLFADSSDNSVVLGQSLLTSSYLVFDVANKKVGIAQVDTEDSNYTTCDMCESVSIICSSCYNVTSILPTLITSTISTTILTSTVITHTYSTAFSSTESLVSSVSSSSTIPVTTSSLIISSSVISSLVPPLFKNSSLASSSTIPFSSTSSSFSLIVSSTTPNCGNTYYTIFSTILSSTSTGPNGYVITDATTSTYSLLTTFSCSISSLSTSSSTPHQSPLVSSSLIPSPTPSSLTSTSLTPSSSLAATSTTLNCGNTYYATFSTILLSTSTGLNGYFSTDVTTSTYSLLTTYSCSISSLSTSILTTHSTTSLITKSSIIPSYLSSSLSIPSYSTSLSLLSTTLYPTVSLSSIPVSIPSMSSSSQIYYLSKSTITTIKVTSSNCLETINKTSSDSVLSTLVSISSKKSSSYILPFVSSSLLTATTSRSSNSSQVTSVILSTIHLDSSECSRTSQYSTSSSISVTTSTPLMCNDIYYKPSVLLSTSTTTDNGSTQRVIYSRTVSYLTSVDCSDSSSSSLLISRISATTISSSITSSTSSGPPLICDQLYYKLTTTVITISTVLSNLAVTTSSYSILTTYVCPSYSISPKSSSLSSFTPVTATTPLTSVTPIISVTLVKSSSTSSFLLSPSSSSPQVLTHSYTPIESFFSTTTDDSGAITTSIALSVFDVLTTYNCGSSSSFSPSTISSFSTSSSIPVLSTESTIIIITTHCNAPSYYTGSFNCSLASILSSLSVPVQTSTSSGLSSYVDSTTISSISYSGRSLSSYKNSFILSSSYQPGLPKTSDDHPSSSKASSSIFIPSSTVLFNSSPPNELSSFSSNLNSKPISSVPVESTIVKSFVGTPTYLPINESSTTIFTASSPIVSIYEGSANSVSISDKSISLLILYTLLLITFVLILL